jgi:hypothetical protein
LGNLTEEEGEFVAGGKILQGRKSWAKKTGPKNLGQKSRAKKSKVENVEPEKQGCTG